MTFMKNPIAIGDGLKARKLDSGALEVSGYLVRFTSADDPDLTGDFFTKSTYYGPGIDGKAIPLYYHHGLQLKVLDPDTKETKMVGPGRRKIGEGTIKADDVGLFYTAVVDESEEYLQAIGDIVEEGKAYYSSGAVSHVVSRKAHLDSNGEFVKAYEITQWLLGEGSITHSPAEPRNGVAGAESKTGSVIKSLGSIAPPTIEAKGLQIAAKSALASYGQYSWDYKNDWDDDWSPASELSYTLHDTIGYRLVRAIRNISTDENMTPTEQETALRACFDEYKEIMIAVTMALIIGVQIDDETETKALKSFLKHVEEGDLPTKSAKTAPRSGLSLAEQGKQALGALQAYTERLESVKSLRAAKSSPPLSAESTKTLEDAEALITAARKGALAPAPSPPTGNPLNPAPGADDDAVKSFTLSPEKIEEFKALGILD